MLKEFGDFPTPPALVANILCCLNWDGEQWARVLEPTCGSGNFIRGLLALHVPPEEIWAIELNAFHYQQAKALIQQSPSTCIHLQQAKLFDLNLQHLPWQATGRLLVLGNPPWITNAELGFLGSQNLPNKTNFKRFKGIDAVTGHSNFDLTESIWLKLIQELASEKPTIALLCKTAVARNVLHYAYTAKLPIHNASIRRIDSQKWFGAAVSACLFCLDVGTDTPVYEAKVYSDLYTNEPEATIGIKNGTLIADLPAYDRTAHLAGSSSITWRQGLKHDAASVMELTQLADEVLQNKLGETVLVEPDYVYPLLKGTDLFHGRMQPQRSVIVTQQRLNDDTNHLQYDAPKLWHYLNTHIAAFDKRKSSIYRNKPLFSMFGIGDYAFALYKVGISGLHKTPRFRVIAPVHDRPVMLDDTCYFIPCQSLKQATALADWLNSPSCLEFLRSRSFTDAKRPITKKLLQSINLDNAFN